MIFDAEFEEAILGQALRDVDYVKQALRLCDGHHFGSKERSWVWGVIADTWHKFGEIPTGKVFVSRAREDFKDETKREPNLKLVSKLVRTRPSAPKSALEELEKFVRYVNAQLALETGAAALEKGDIDACYKALGAAAKASVGRRKYTLVHWSEEFEDRQAARKYEREHPEEITAIKTGWPTIDGITGGARLGELCLVMGTTGRGKSIALNNIAHRAAGAGDNVLIVPFEMPARQVASRQDARWLGIDYKKLKEYDLLPAELRSIKARYDKAKKHFEGRIKIASFPVRSATIYDVKSLLDDLKAEHDWRPKVIMMDSADHLRAVDSAKEAFRLQQSEVYWAAKALAEDDGYVVWSSVHASAQWAGMTATAEASAESYDKARIADLIISINDPEYKERMGKKTSKVVVEDDEDEDDDDSDDEFEIPATRERTLELFLSKYRDGEANRVIPVRADFHKMTIEEIAKK